MAVQASPAAAGGMGLESVNKITQLPVVESTLGLASDMYKKVKVCSMLIGSVPFHQ